MSKVDKENRRLFVLCKVLCTAQYIEKQKKEAIKKIEQPLKDALTQKLQNEQIHN
jgi:hypothetical protein